MSTIMVRSAQSSASAARAADEPDEGCPFTAFGCPYEGGRQTVKRHIKETPSGHLEHLCGGVRALKEETSDAQIALEYVSRKFEALDHRIHELSVIFSTQFVWRIDNYRYRFQEAKLGKKRVIFSPPFYSAKEGYKMAASIALNGDGPGRNKFCSVFLTILRGECDSLLPWPFAAAVQFTLLEQRWPPDERRNVTQILKPNTTKENRPFLGRPAGDRNPSFGVQKFISLEDMNVGEYIKDDAIFLKVEIELADNPLV